MLLQKLITSSALVEDPSPVASTSRSLILGETDGLLSYKATTRLIALSNCHFSNWDIDSCLLFLLKERGFLPLSAALLSSFKLHSEVRQTRDLFMDITSYISSIILSLVFCRSGLMFLLLDPELSTTVISARTK
ncbi:embryo defective protein [Tanacetum coccineum]|uniref:Embryo defective protein n=1 Tax=Tanacetum coccineum TaxID=301880 RepID=A0ABQ5ERS7_9ASTR